MTLLRAGTRVELHGTPEFGVAAEVAVIDRWLEKVSGPRMDGWHIVKFAHGGKLCVHETRFRVLED